MSIVKKSNNTQGIETPPKGEQLEAKMKLLALLPYDERVRRRHCLVFGFVVDWYYDSYGNALAAALFVAEQLELRRHWIPNGKGLSRSQVHATLTDLVCWNFLIEIKGMGRRASRYIPNWSLVWPPRAQQVCVPSCPDAISVPSCPDDCVLNAGDTNGASILNVGDEDPFTRPGQRPRDVYMDNNPLAAAAGAGLSASAEAVPAAARVPGGFDEFWAIFPKKLKFDRTRAAYEKLAPDAALHAQIIEKAKQLAAHHAEHGTDFKWIKEPANWLAGKCWKEDMPAVYGKPEAVASKPKPSQPASARKPKAKPTVPKASNDNLPAARTSWQRVEIVKSVVIDVPGGNALRATIHGEGGTEVIETINLESQKHEVQDAGQRQFSALRTAVGVDDIEDSAELHNRPFERRVVGGKPEYRAIIADAA